jgi:hypothetical protein
MAFNDAPTYGSATAEFDLGSETISLMRLWTDGGIAISFAELKLTSAFAELAARQELLDPCWVIRPDDPPGRDREADYGSLGLDILRQ